jgi:Icc-related predicted phosphoesterase
VLIGFIGDVHGRVYHMLAALAAWQETSGKRLDLIIQVGDMGAFPHTHAVDAATALYAHLDDAERDFARFLAEDVHVSACLQRLRNDFRLPIHFINGNHDDIPWLQSLLGSGHDCVDIDPLHFLRYVRNGSVVEFDGVRVAFLGWGGDQSESDSSTPVDGYSALVSLAPGSCDVLVTHEAPYGASQGRDGRVQGTERIATLVDALQPRVHVFGHLHHLNGPHTRGRTVSLGLSSLVPSARWQPHATGLKPGCFAVLDTDSYVLNPVTGAWLTSFPTPFRLDQWCAAR